MKFIVKKYIKKEIEVKSILLVLPIDEEDMPNDFPFRDGKVWRVEVDIDSGKIKDWPGPKFHLYMRVFGKGSYYLLDAKGKKVAKIEKDYVPNEVVPGVHWEHGDCVSMNILKDGTIRNWPKNLKIDAFFSEEDEVSLKLI